MKRYKDYILDIILLLILAAGLTVVSFIFVQPNMNFEVLFRFLKAPLVLVLNFLPIFSVMLILYFITRRVWSAFLIGIVLVIAMGITNVSKIFYRQEVFKVVDFNLIGEATKMVQNNFNIHYPRSTFLIVFMLLAIDFVIFKFRKFVVEKKARWIGLGVSIVIFFGVLKLTTNQKIYYNNEHSKAKGFNKWVTVETSKAHGMVYSFMHSFTELSIVPPENYDEDYAKSIFEKYKDEDMPEDKKVNIIAIMFESFNDFSRYNVDFVKYPYNSYDDVKRMSVAGSIIVDIFGGGTVHTERTFMTGNYNQTFYNRPQNSYVWYLKSQGYNTVAMHPHMGGFYNRVTVNKNLGFDEFMYDENYFNKHPSEIYPRPDRDLFEHILKDYREKKKTGKPYFNMTVTMQNHGPYPDTKAPYEYIRKSELLDEKTYNEINNYFDGIRQSSDALKNLLEKLKYDDKPVVVFAFGDHNPFLGVNEIGFEAMGIDLNPEREEGYLNKYRTPYIIWANEKAKIALKDDFVGQGPEISPQYLLTHFFNSIGVVGPKYMQIKNNEFPFVSIYNKSFIKVEGSLIPTQSKESGGISDKINSLDYYYNTKFMYDSIKERW